MNSRRELEQGRAACLVCGNLTLSKRGAFEICPVCFWEDEGAIDDPDEPSDGPNGNLSLSEARRNYREFGAVASEFADKARQPRLEERPD